MRDQELNYTKSGGVLPPYVAPWEIVRAALPVLEPPERITPSQAVRKYRYVDGDLADFDLTPYMVEPLDLTASRRYGGLVFVGPARTGKTFALVDGVVAHRIACDPCYMQVTQMDRVAARAYTQKKLDPMLRHSPALRERLIVSRPGTLGNMFDKQFRGGGYLAIGYPVASQFASQDIQITIATDFDKMPEDVEGEGDVWTLMKKRGQTFGSRAMAIAESSPRKDIQDENWAPSTVHEFPPVTGIGALYNRGTRAKYYWTCPNCSHEFCADFGHFRWCDSADIEEQAESVYLLCPSGNGCVLEADRKYDLNRSGRWLHESADGKRAVPLGDEAIRRTDIVSYKLNVPQAAYQSWKDAVREFRGAEEHYAKTGDEGPLRTVTNTTLGDPYLPRTRASDMDLNAERLIARSQYRDLGTLPTATRFVTISVDVQANAFICSAEAWGEGLEHWLVDRWSIVSPPEGSPGAYDAQGKQRRGVQPWLYAEDWEVLETLHDRVFPVVDDDGNRAGYGLKPVKIMVDSQGQAGTYERALKFARKMRSLGLFGKDKIYELYKGEGGFDMPRAKRRKPETQNQKKRQQRNDVELVFVCANKLKDEVVSALLREEPGPLAFHLPRTLDRNYVEEFCAERRDEKKGWEKKAGHYRNESLDLAVFAKAAVIIKGAENIRDWSRPPAWAALGPDNSFAVAMDGDGSPSPVAKQKARLSSADLMKELNG